MAGDRDHKSKIEEMGAEIRERRESLGLSLEEASEGTKIRGKYLHGVEAGDESSAPGKAYFGAFLKTYATFLGLDGGEYSAAYRDLLEARSSASKGRGEPARVAVPSADTYAPKVDDPAKADAPSLLPAKPKPLRRSRRSSFSGVWVIVLILAVSLTAFMFWRSRQTPPVPGPDMGSEPSQTLDDPVIPEPPVGQGEPQISPPSVNREDPNANATIFTVDRSPLKLAIRTRDDEQSYCWVRVVCDGTLLMERTIDPDTEIVIEAESLIEIRAGRPWEIHLTLNGESLGLGGVFGPVKDLTFRASEASRPS